MPRAAAAAVPIACLAAALAAARSGGGEPAPAAPVDFARNVRPILADKCFGCHGPDDATREAELRLDTKDGLFADRGGYSVVVPGKSAESEMWARIGEGAKPQDRMPPPTSGKSLSESEAELLRRWIEEGAAYSQHWAFEPPLRPAPPAVARADWARGDVDRFVLARLEAEGLEPRPEADRTALLRRLSFDLTGLPPTVAELDRFLSDSSPDAYEKEVDRLLASPRYGERQAQEWLDLARYADSNGDGYDGQREMWPWRDWVIRAFNENKPFDQFTIEQIAGDLLPDATREQRLATGFHRNHTIFTKGGAQKDEYRHAYVADRVNTTATVWMGLTIACAQCHDHKYDPFSQREYYELYAFFNNVSERDVGGGRRNSAPFVHVPDAETGAKLDALAADIERLQRELEAEQPEWDAAQIEWQAEALAGRGEPIAWTALDTPGALSLGGTKLERQADGSYLASGPNPGQDVYHLVAQPGKTVVTGLRLEVLPHESFVKGGSGRSEKGGFLLNEMEVYVGSFAAGSEGDKVRFARAEDDVTYERSVDADKAADGSERSGWSLVGDEVSEPHEAIFVPAEPLELNEFSFLRVVLQQKQVYRYRNTIGRFRVSYTTDPRTIRQTLPVLAKSWHAVGPFPAPTAAEAHATAFEPEKGIPKGIDVDLAKYAKVVLPKDAAKKDGAPDEAGSGAKPPAPAADAKPAESAPPAPSAAEGASAAAAAPAEKVARAVPPADKPADPQPDADGEGDGPGKKDDEQLRWEEKKDWRDGARIKLDGKYSAWFLQRALDVDRERKARVMITGEAGLKVWLDGQLVFERAPAEKPPRKGYGGDFGGFDDFGDDEDFDPDDDEFLEKRARAKPQYDGFDVALTSGEHRLVLKVVTGEKGESLTMRLQPLGRDVLCHAVERVLRGAWPQPAPVAAPAAPEAAKAKGPTPAQARAALVREWFRRYVSPPASERYAELDRKRLEKKRIEARLPTSMVLDDKAPRETHVLVRGAWEQKGEKVGRPDAPAILPPLPASPDDAAPNRLTLARWLVSGQHPLTARVAVNRIWRQYFGAALVETTGDFGTRGALPSHPELLDWLACQFVASGWDQKALHRAIVTSATYRQEATGAPASDYRQLLQRDPDNRLLARGPRLRLSAEMVRDNALAASGLLVEHVGGESVKPYQPKGLWESVGGFGGGGNDDRYEQDKGEKLYRRGIYTYWKRGVLHPALSTFDAPVRATCVSERIETNTPLQSLALLNDPAQVEAARALGARMMKEGGSDTSSRLIYGFRLCTSRVPSQRELAVLLRVFGEQKEHYAADEKAAKSLVGVGESKAPSELDARELAAWAAVGSVLLNLDATIHRG